MTRPLSRQAIIPLLAASSLAGSLAWLASAASGRPELLAESVLASTRGSSTGSKAYQANASCSDNQAYTDGGGSVAWDKCSASNTPQVGPPPSCIFCLDRTTQGTIPQPVPLGTGNYTPSQGADTVCGSKRVGYCGQSPVAPTVYTCQFDQMAGQCGGLPQNGLYQSPGGGIGTFP